MSERDESIRQKLKTMVENGVKGAEKTLEGHERNLLSQNRKRAARKKAKKVARASRKKNR